MMIEKEEKQTRERRGEGEREETNKRDSDQSVIESMSPLHVWSREEIQSEREEEGIGFKGCRCQDED